MHMIGRFLEDFAVGQTFRSGRVRIDTERIKTFGAEFDPQPFHLDEEAARDTIFGGLAASGWHTAAITMRLLVESDLKPAGGIVGAGADEFRWPRPVRPGDELRTESEVLAVRPSRSRPDQGLIKALAARLTSETGRSVTALPADLSDKSGLAKVEAILRDDQTIAMLVNNAGIGAVAPLLSADVERMDDIIALNITALTHLTYAVAPAFVARGAGTIINIASVVGISPETLNGVYGASKAYVLALTHSLQHELGAKGLRIQAVLPGATATEIWDKAGLPVQNLPASIVMSPE